jgi:hypothetical protein
MSDTTAEPTQAAAQPSEKGTQISKVWVPVILVIAILLGLVLGETVSLPPYVCPPYYCPPAFLLSVQRALMLHVILSTIEIVLLVSLVAVYIRVYLETRANFSLGLIIVLGALLVHSVLSFPLVLSYLPTLLGSGLFFPYTDLLTIIAYTVFLYLSLG